MNAGNSDVNRMLEETEEVGAAGMDLVIAKEAAEAEMKRWIDNASYEELLRKWRYAPTGDPFFHNDTGMGACYSEVMKKRKEEVGHAAAVAASKAIDR